MSCRVAGCGDPVQVKSLELCNMHYLRHRRGADLNAPSRQAAHKSPLLKRLVEEGASLGEIQRTLGVDHRTVKRYFPDYEPWPVGSSPQARVVREASAVLR